LIIVLVNHECAYEFKYRDKCLECCSLIDIACDLYQDIHQE
jgi:hypothetical protein